MIGAANRNARIGFGLVFCDRDTALGGGKSPNTSPLSARTRAHAREAAGNQRPWPADKVERWAIDRLIPYAKNARTHTDAQIAAIAASIKEWGWTTPALVGEDGGLIAGHARVLAARQLGIVEIPVMVAAREQVGPRDAPQDFAARPGRNAGSKQRRRQHFPSLAARAPARESRPEIKDRGRPTRSSAGRSIG